MSSHLPPPFSLSYYFTLFNWNPFSLSIIPPSPSNCIIYGTSLYCCHCWPVSALYPSVLLSLAFHRNSLLHTDAHCMEKGTDNIERRWWWEIINWSDVSNRVRRIQGKEYEKGRMERWKEYSSAEFSTLVLCLAHRLIKCINKPAPVWLIIPWVYNNKKNFNWLKINKNWDIANEPFMYLQF